MLKKFTVNNYKIFHSPITLDFSKVRDYKFNEDSIAGGIINKSILYGKNAVGKTSLGNALMDIRSSILPNDMGTKDSIGYVNANSETDFVSFTYTFQFDDLEIIYHYEKYEPTKFKKESLKIDGTILYEFNFDLSKGQFINLKKYEEVKHLNLDEWDSESSVLRYILTNSKLKELKILKSLSSFVEGMAFLKPSDDIVRFKGPKILKSRIIPSIIEENLVDDFMSFLKNAGINVSLIVDEKPDGEKSLYFNYKRPLEFISNASSGTKALTSLYWVIKSLKKINFLFVDEFDANFHYELAEIMLKQFKSLTECQILVTTHNTDLMSNKYMRPDCYFIMLPNEILSIAEATYRELRQGHNLEKLYQSGEFNEMVSE